MPVAEDGVLALESGTVVLGGTVVLDDVNLRVESGELVALLGANGSGKTTLVRASLGLAPLTRGKAFLFGSPLGDFRDWRRIGYVPQRFTASSGVPAMVEEVVRSGRAGSARMMSRQGQVDRDAAAHALDLVDLADFARRSVSSLSGGQQQRVLIARALARRPDLLILDEPISSVDVEHQESFAATLAGIRSEGRSILLVAHALGPMEELVTREIVLHAGRIAYEGPHLPHHVHEEPIHHPPSEPGTSPLDRAAGGS